MNKQPNPDDRTLQLIATFIDGELSPTDVAELNELLRGNPKLAEQVVDQLVLDSLLTEELAADSLTGLVDVLSTPTLEGSTVAITSAPDRTARRHWAAVKATRPWWRSFAVSTGILATFTAMFLFVFEMTRSSASAATELKRLIAAQDHGVDKTYLIAVEENPVPQRRPRQGAEDRRPPKPPLDQAMLHVRSPNQFVLIRKMPDGQPFVTGSNGMTSWAVRPDGPVRVSTDLTRFNRDLPGHEHDIPLIQIEQGLEHLRKAYVMELLPIEFEEDVSTDNSPTRLLVAVKRRGYRGPQRVEITYVVATGQIRQLRFIGMPYGPEHLNVRLSLVDDQSLGDTFFDHQSHHAPDRRVKEE